MKVMTIGALFNDQLNFVLLIKKEKPDWQKGRFNLPGGKTEVGESAQQCVSREFAEEANLTIAPERWKLIGQIINVEAGYRVDFLTATIDAVEVIPMRSLTDEECLWFELNDLPPNCLSNLYWLIPFALNTHKQGNNDFLQFGTFDYGGKQ